MHKLNNDYPLASETIEISQNLQSNYYCNISNEYRIKIGVVNKLVPHLGNKSKYVLHYKNLQLYLSLGLKLTKDHRLLKFKKSHWYKKTLILIQTKAKLQQIVFKKTFLN